jgi:hypothetical protein
MSKGRAYQSVFASQNMKDSFTIGENSAKLVGFKDHKNILIFLNL